MKKFDLRDIVLIPAIISRISSRKECNTLTSDGYLPLIASPMDTVVCNKNINKFIDNKIIPCSPRGKYIKNQSGMYFQSFGLSEIEEQLSENYMGFMVDEERKFFNHKYILIDIANGHMEKLIDIVKEIKNRFPYIKLMVGNIANPLTFKVLAQAGADYVRLGIGVGAGCTTSSNVSVHYPMGSLIKECRNIKDEYGFETKIVADGGMQGFDDINKAIGIGADYVMVGSIFNKAIESAGFNYLYGIRIPYWLAKFLYKKGFTVKKKYRGMSTKSVQRSWGKKKLTTAEGITKYQKVEYSLKQWTENFNDYLKSCMSYCDSKILEDFIGNVDYEFITYNALMRFKK